MKWFKRISLFLLTNFLILITISVTMNIILPFFGIRLDPAGMGGLLAMCLLWGFGGAFISLLLSKFMAKRMMGVRVIDPATSNATEQELIGMVHRLARTAGLSKMPEVGIYEAPDINAFATGPTKNNSLVAVSTGLLRNMTKPEIEGVIGHEVAHVANGDMVTMTLVQGVVNAFVMFLARIAARLIASQADERYRGAIYFGVSIALDIVFGILGSMVVAYFSRLREFRADAGGAQYAGREKMIAGLRRLQATYDRMEPDDRALAAMKISNKPAGFMALFSTHPPLAVRIERLESMTIMR